MKHNVIVSNNNGEVIFSIIAPDFEITGTASSRNDGRKEHYSIEPDAFDCEDAETYWDENWEEIEEQVNRKA